MRELKRKTSLEYDNAIPLTATLMDIVVYDGVMARLSVNCSFKNRESSAISAFYVMPASYGSAIYDMRLLKDGIETTAEYFDSEKAFEIFDNAQENGGEAFLLEAIEEDSVAVSIGVLKPGGELSVSFKCALLSEIKDDLVSFRIPLSISPRYAPIYADPLRVDMLNPPAWKHVPYSTQLRFSGTMPGAKKISSPSHDIKIILDEKGVFCAESRGSGLDPDRDLIFEIELEKPLPPSCLAAHCENGTNAAIFSIVPEFDDQKSRKSPIVFILDCSASMTGASFDKAKEALEFCIRLMREGTVFNILTYSDSAEFFSPAMTGLDNATAERALSYIDAIGFGDGGSELLNALEEIQGMVSESKLEELDVVLITDGNSCGSRRILEYAAGCLRNIRFFTFGAGYGASHHLIKGLAEMSGGAWEFISPGTDVMEKALRHFSRMERPSVKELNFSGKFNSVDYEAGIVIPALYDGDGAFFLTTADEFPVGKEFKISCRTGRKKYSWSCECRSSGCDELIPILWAGAMIKKLEMKKLLTRSSDEYSELCGAVTRIGKRFKILTQDTSFCLSAKDNPERPCTETPLYRRIPVMLTKDSAREIYPRYDASSLTAASYKQDASAIYGVGENAGSYGEKASFNFKNLLDIQTADGFFEHKPQIISRFLGTSVPSYEGIINFIVTDSVGRKKQDIVKNIIATVLALDIMEKNQQSGLFSNSMARARQWLSMAQSKHKFADFVELLAIKHFKI
ncbi:MAG: hypothetical protein A2020_06620 [Lentisphaerae bacterium GWF2_45_14]|nr:MAG: hypothetical protein A2020_06620 [Lentisphaerae bacterium GWF2_45_14]